jgi:hypothetical protein
LDEIEDSKVWLNDEHLLNDDVLHCQNFLIISSSMPQLTLINLYQFIRRKHLSISEIKSDYIFVSAEQFKNQENSEAVNKAFQSVTNPTLIIDCACLKGKVDTELGSTLKISSTKTRAILIADTDVEQTLQDKLKKYQANMMHDRECVWSDLTSDSKNDLLKTPVSFQGRPILLNALISVESRVTKFLPLPDLLQKRTIEIGRPLLTSALDWCSENYYIPRTFIHQVAIKKDIFEQKLSKDLVTTTEQGYRECCQENPEKNVHFLQQEKSVRFIWHQSQGSFGELRNYIDTLNPRSYPPEKLDEFLQQSQRQEVILIADIAGMGKTTVLTHLSQQIKKNCPGYWLIRIDLNNHTNVLEAQARQKRGTVEILYERLLKFCCQFEKELFKQCCLGLE